MSRPREINYGVLFRMYARGATYSRIGDVVGKPKNWICAAINRLIRQGDLERRPMRVRERRAKPVRKPAPLRVVRVQYSAPTLPADFAGM